MQIAVRIEKWSPVNPKMIYSFVAVYQKGANHYLIIYLPTAAKASKPSHFRALSTQAGWKRLL